LENNFGLHPEVNANIFALLKNSGLSQYINKELIIKSQATEGYWYSYFYPSRYYSTYLFLDLLRDMNGFEAQKNKGLEFIQDSQNKNGSWGNQENSFETALALCSLAYLNQYGLTFENGLDYLLQTQQPDGSWRFEQLIYKWYNHDHKTWLAYDANHVITTSLCVEGLRSFLNAHSVN